jgi:hypothetical protein
MNPREYRSPADAELIRYLDGELDAQEKAGIEARLAADNALRERLETLRRRGRKLSSLLDATDTPPPAATAAAPERRPRRPALLAAAIVLLIIGAAVLVPPVRAWIASQWQRTPGDESAPANAAAQADAPALADTLNVSFPVGHPTFDIELLNLQARGQLVVFVTDSTSGSATIRNGKGEETFLFPGGIRFINGAESTADYEVAVPRSVRRVTVRLPDRPFIIFSTLDTASQRRVIDLREGR